MYILMCYDSIVIFTISSKIKSFRNVYATEQYYLGESDSCVLITKFIHEFIASVSKKIMIEFVITLFIMYFKTSCGFVHDSVVVYTR